MTDSEQQSTKKGLVYFIATVIALVIGIAYNLSGVDYTLPVIGFGEEYLTTAHEFGLVLWILAVFALVAGIGISFYLLGYTLIYASKFFVWVCARFQSRDSVEDDPQ